MSLGEDVDAEVEALRYTYGEELSIGTEGHTCTLSITVQPHTGGDSSVQFVQARLQLLVDGSYPACGPSVTVLDAKGMDDARIRALWQHLQQEAELACGELVLGHLIELAKDHLTASNVPDGACMICLDGMAADTGASTSASDAEGAAALAKLPCFHAFHTPCLVRWWAWRQAELYAQEQALTKRAGALAAAVLKEDQLPAKEGGFYSTGCPICRKAFALSQLGPGVERLLRATLRQGIQAAAGSSTAEAEASEHTAGRRLTAAQVAPFLALQKQHADMLARQRQQGGLIEEVGYAMAEWEPFSSTGSGSSSVSTSAAAGSRASQPAGSGDVGAGRERGGAGSHHTGGSTSRHALHAGGRREQSQRGRGQLGRRGRGGPLETQASYGRGGPLLETQASHGRRGPSQQQQHKPMPP